MALLLAFAFLSGLVTILAPCVWPLLPIVLSSGATGKDHMKSLGITLGVMLSFAVFTLAISFFIRFFHFDPNLLRLLAVIVLAFLGLTMLIPKLAQLTEGAISRLTGFFGQKTVTGNDFVSGFITGLSLGIVWSPCAGPILAAIATLAATGNVSLDVVLVMAAYIAGIGLPLFLLSYGGQIFFSKTKFISPHIGLIQKIFGVIMILTALAIYTNYDVYLEAQLLNDFPQLNLTSLENNPAVKKQLDILKGKQTTTITGNSDLFNANQPAPDFVGISKWLNSNQLTLAQLKGKVVLVDFWTYTCINCIRTLPHLTSWYSKYKQDGFVIVGVHTPEFAFEHDTNNVAHAISMYDITYPVAQDNDYATWNVYGNQYWPAEYLIDATGQLRRVHFGEGEYDKTEQAIQELLRENGKKVATALDTMPDQTPKMQLSPESYLGTNRMQYFYPGNVVSTGTQTFVLPPTIPQNSFSFGGTWTINPENAVTKSNAVLSYHSFANRVFLVMRPGANSNPTVKVFIDGKLVDITSAGSDVKNGIITIDSDRLYNLIDLKGNVGNHTLRLEFDSPGIEAFAFTFG